MGKSDQGVRGESGLKTLPLKAIRNQPVLRLVKGVDQAVTIDRHGVFGSGCHCHKQAADGTVPAAMAAPIQKKFQDEAATRSRKIIDTAGAVAKAASIPCGGVSVISDSPTETIIKQAGKSKCDVIVMASHGRRSLQGFLLGSETTKVLCHTKMPALVVR